MPLNPDDWTIDRATKAIRYTGSDHGGSPVATYTTVIEFHRWIGDLADDAVSVGNDELDITDPTPTDRSTDNIVTLINGYNIDDTAAEHIYDGSVIQDGGNTIYDGVVNFGNASNIQIIQNGAVLADDWWNVIGGGGLNADTAAGISHRFMIKVRTAAADIDGRRLIGTTREFGKTYGEFSINGSARGNNVLALSDATDLNNATVAGTVATWTTISNTTEGYKLLDVDNNSVNEPYYSEWNRDTYTINQMYERLKWLTRRGAGADSPHDLLYGLEPELFRGVTHEIALSTGSGTWGTPEFEEVTWSGGTGQLLAVDNKTGTSSTKLWIQLLTGVAPTDTQVITGTTSSATGTASGTATSRTISTPFHGSSTGSALIGGYGIGVETLDLGSADLLRDLNDATHQPPNNVTFTVSGLVAGEDRVLVGPEDGAGGLDYDQLSLATALTTDNITSVEVSGPIPTDTPAAGYIRVQDDNGVYRRLHYSGWNDSPNTFDIDTTDGNEDFGTVGAAVSNNVFVAYIDELLAVDSPIPTTLQFTSVYNVDRDLFIRVRDGGTTSPSTPIKTFETTSTLASGGGSTTAIRTPDV